MATATARVGYAMGRTLCSTARAAPPSKTAASSATCFNPQGGAACAFPRLLQSGWRGVCQRHGFSTSSTRVGWTIGYGTEFDLGKNWSAKAEYDYISFGSHTALASDGTTTMRDRADISQVKVGLNYRFAPRRSSPSTSSRTNPATARPAEAKSRV